MASHTRGWSDTIVVLCGCFSWVFPGHCSSGRSQLAAPAMSEGQLVPAAPLVQRGLHIRMFFP